MSHHYPYSSTTTHQDHYPYSTTTTTVETREYVHGEPAVELEMPKFDTTYCKTLGGLVKIFCIFLNLLVFFCVLIGGSGHYTGASWATFVSSVGLSVTTTLLFLYICRVVDAIQQFNWIVAEMCFCFAWTIFYFIAASVLAVAAAKYSGTGGWALASFFAFGAMCAYGFDCYLKFLAWKHDEIATGGGVDYLEQYRNKQRRDVQNI